MLCKTKHDGSNVFVPTILTRFSRREFKSEFLTQLNNVPVSVVRFFAIIAVVSSISFFLGFVFFTGLRFNWFFCFALSLAV